MFELKRYESRLLTLWLVVPVVLLWAGFEMRRWYGIQDPGDDPPAPVMPVHNTFDTLRRLGETTRTDKDAIGRAVDGKPERDDPKPAGLLAKYARTLRSVRDTLPQGEFRLPASRSFKDEMPYLADFRNLARLFVLEGQEQERNGAFGAATESYYAALLLGERVSHGGALIDNLVSIAILARARRACWGLLPNLGPGELNRWANQIQAVDSRRATLADTLTEYKYFAQGAVLQYFRHPEQVISADDAKDFDPRDLPSSTWYAFHPKREIYQHFTDYMDAVIQRARQPYRPNWPDIPIPKDPLSEILPAYTPIAMQDLVARTDGAILVTACGLRAYRQRFGAYPDTLARLTERGILSTLPIDPFSGERCSPLAYRKTGGDAYLLYSVGPDSRDDGGRPIDNPKKEPGKQSGYQRWGAFADSQGDIVAGINFPTPRTP